MDNDFLFTVSEELKKISSRSLSEFMDVIESGHKVFIYGNGGSAGIASHIAIDLTKALSKPCFTFTDPSLVTCFSNDFGFEQYVVECIRNFVSKDDVVILMSSSGASPNVVNAAKFCAEKKIAYLSLSGFSRDNPLSKLNCNGHFYIESENYNIVETVHFLFLIAVIEKMRLKL